MSTPTTPSTTPTTKQPYIKPSLIKLDTEKHLSYGFFQVTEKVARAHARAAGARLPRPGYMLGLGYGDLLRTLRDGRFVWAVMLGNDALDTMRRYR